MPLSFSDKGSGEFVAEKVWTCPVHDRPEWHECDCEHCPWVEPDCCANAEWVDKVDANGNVVMREVGMMEQFLFRDFVPAALDKVSFLEEMLAKAGAGDSPKFLWNEDETVPIVRAAGDVRAG